MIGLKRLNRRFVVLEIPMHCTPFPLRLAAAAKALSRQWRNVEKSAMNAEVCVGEDE
jgi:hypothetical protein